MKTSILIIGFCYLGTSAQTFGSDLEELNHYIEARKPRALQVHYSPRSEEETTRLQVTFLSSLLVEKGEEKEFLVPEGHRVVTKETALSGLTRLKVKNYGRRREVPIRTEGEYILKAPGLEIIGKDAFIIKIVPHSDLSLELKDEGENENILTASLVETTPETKPTYKLSIYYAPHDFYTAAMGKKSPWDLMEDFKDGIMPSRGIDPRNFYLKANQNWHRLRTHLKSERSDDYPRKPLEEIPVHTIWLTSKETPKELPQSFIKLLRRSIRACPPKKGYRHILWVIDKSLTPETIENLQGAREEKAAPLEILEAFSLPLDPEIRALFEKAVLEKNWGKASDILRYAMLFEMGGIYRDTDYEIARDPRPFIEKVDCLTGFEAPDDTALCNAFLYAKPKHPLMGRCLEYLKLSLEELPYLDPYKTQSTYFTLLWSGPFMLTLALGEILREEERGIFKEGLGIMALPPAYLFPRIKRYGSPLPRGGIGIHYHAMSWCESR